MEFGICSEIFRDWKMEEAMAFAAQAGYDAMEIAPFTIRPCVTDITASERQHIQDCAQRCGLAISGIHWVLVQTEGLHLTHPEGAVRERTARYFRDLVDFCADLGGRFIIVGSPKQRDVLPGVSPEQAWQWAGEVFRSALDRAGERAVTICLEPLAPAETNFINTAQEAVRFIREFSHPCFKIILDVKAMCSESKPIPQIIRESAPHLGYVHANDENLKGPGFGKVDFQPIAAALRDAGYDGYVSVEVFNFEDGPEVIARQSMTYLRSVFASA